MCIMMKSIEMWGIRLDKFYILHVLRSREKEFGKQQNEDDQERQVGLEGARCCGAPRSPSSQLAGNQRRWRGAAGEHPSSQVPSFLQPQPPVHSTRVTCGTPGSRSAVGLSSSGISRAGDHSTRYCQFSEWRKTTYSIFHSLAPPQSYMENQKTKKM